MVESPFGPLGRGNRVRRPLLPCGPALSGPRVDRSTAPELLPINIQGSKGLPGPSRTGWSPKLRLDGVRTIAGANYLLRQFLERFNRQFAVAPAQPQTAYPIARSRTLILMKCSASNTPAGSPVTTPSDTDGS